MATPNLCIIQVVQSKVPEQRVAAYRRRKTLRVFDRYNIVSERDLDEAAVKLERHLAELEKAREGATSRQLPGSGEFGARKLLMTTCERGGIGRRARFRF